jgi:hypothetical protein
MRATRPAGLVRRWVRLYTRGLPAELRDGRRNEIDADLWSQLEEAALLGRTSRSTNTEILIRWLAGIPADLSWRVEHRGENTVTTSTLSPRVGSQGATGLGLATVVAGLGLALLFVLFAISVRAVAPANPYYMSWPGTMLVLLGSAAELLLGSALFGYSLRFGDRFHRVATVAAAAGGLLSIMSAVGAYTLIGTLPVATAIVAWNLARLRVIGGWLAAIHAVSSVLFIGFVVAAVQTAQGSAYSDILFLTPLWPLTLVAIGLAVARGEPSPEPAPAA